MGLFGKKKKEEPPESLGFGFPATEKEKEIEGVTSLTPPPPKEPIAPEPIAAPEPEMPAPKPMAPAPARAMPEPMLEPRPAPTAMPEEIMAPRAPTITKLRPHVFLKINKYKEVMSSIDRVMNHIKDLKKSLDNIRDIEEKEALKIKESESVLNSLEEVAGVFDKIFSNPEK